jgi:hypothetical protein
VLFYLLHRIGQWSFVLNQTDSSSLQNTTLHLEHFTGSSGIAVHMLQMNSLAIGWSLVDTWSFSMLEGRLAVIVLYFVELFEDELERLVFVLLIDDVIIIEIIY